ncbi:MAG: sensor histidine kinase, partial [Chloroflexi bacterium]|nr:sensor histidine kinase [Chloroflexota bacterium]
TRISRDSHDSVAQGLSGLLWQIDEIEDSIKTDSDDTFELIAMARHAATSSLLDTRRAVWGLRPGELGGKGLPDALRRETERIAHEGHLMWEFKSTGEPFELTPQVELALLRVGQEAVYNTVRHADANRVAMTLQWNAGSVNLVITDDGIGFVVDDATGAIDSAHGLHAMKERAQESGATLEIRSIPGAGTSVTMKVPSQR